MAARLTECIRDGTFPDSNELLDSEATVDDITSLLTDLTNSRNQLRDEIRDVSKNTAGDVDEWIIQARKLQEDIARCKLEARQIVEEHERGEQLRNVVKDAANKVQLLESEIAFTKVLEHEIQNVSEITRILKEVDKDLISGDPVLAVGKVGSLDATIKVISAGQTRSLLAQLDGELRQRSQKQLEQLVDSRWVVSKSASRNTLTVHLDMNDEQSAELNGSHLRTDDVLQALYTLQALPTASSLVLHTLDSFVRSVISTKSAPYPSSVEVKDHSLVVTSNESKKEVHKILAILQVALQFWYEHLPQQIRDGVAYELLPKVISELITKWLDPALPYELHDLQQLEPLRGTVSKLAEQLQQYAWPGVDALKEWVEQIPRGWLTKRRIASLDGVRKAFSLARGSLRAVERVERQSIPVEVVTDTTKEPDDDWSAEWDDETSAKTTEKASTDEDDASGWDFDTEDEATGSADKQAQENKKNDDDDASDAWGWGDDETTTEVSKQEISTHKKHAQTNGESNSAPKVQEMVLTETYFVTDIPDYILEIVGKDLADSRDLGASASSHFNGAPPVTGLAGLSNLTLALFRATAPTYYSLPSANYVLNNINLYNDTLYIVQKLNESPDVTILQPSIDSLSRFARQIYSAELEIQRTILTDILDGAQGFDRCNTFPNSQACIDAVSGTVDRLRQLHKEWSTILGESHLLQSLGSLMTMIFGKIIKDIEDMDDISEAESKQLVTFCQQILSLEDLFVSRLPDLTRGSTDSTQQASQSQIMLYVPNYFRFQYLQQILDSSLVDIKYLWTEGELSLEFSVDEVEDLIKALFAESQHRRNAIRDIKGSSGR